MGSVSRTLPINRWARAARVSLLPDAGPAASELSLAVSLVLDGLEPDCRLKAIFCSRGSKLVKLQRHRVPYKSVVEIVEPVSARLQSLEVHAYR